MLQCNMLNYINIGGADSAAAFELTLITTMNVIRIGMNEESVVRSKQDLAFWTFPQLDVCMCLIGVLIDHFAAMKQPNVSSKCLLVIKKILTRTRMSRHSWDKGTFANVCHGAR